MAERYTGSAVRRTEDARILTGRGCYVDDVRLPGMVHAAFVRSPFPHAHIVNIDVTAARAAPGVVGVYTAADLEPFISHGTFGVAAAMGVTRPAYTALATDRVRLVGDLVALVIAETRGLGEDACDLVDVEYEELPVVATVAHALDASRLAVFEELGTNVAVGPELNVYGDVEGVFARADRVIRARLHTHRQQNVPMECRGSVTRFDAATGELAAWSASQGVHMVRVGLAERLGIPFEKIRVRSGDVGGSFGQKVGASREDVACAVAAMLLDRPVKWIEDRNENLMASSHARDDTLEVEAAVSDGGDLLGLKVEMLIDTGAYPGRGNSLGSKVEGLIPGPYQVRALSFESTAIITNKATYGAYRGPWASETWVRERLMDLIAREVGMDPIELRLRNLADAGAAPATMITGVSLAGTTTRQSLERIRDIVDIPAFRRRQEVARAEGRYLGLGVATFLEPAPGFKPRAAPPERIRMELTDSGALVVYTGQMPHGQGHETTIAQVAADEVGVRFEDVKVVVGDSAVVPPGLTGGSRAAPMAGGAALTAGRALRVKLLQVASHLFEASVDDLEIGRGVVSVRGVPGRPMQLAQVVTAARQPRALPREIDTNLQVDLAYDGGTGGWSGGTHCAIVEVDLETGFVRFDRYLVVEDCGVLINPAIVEGQIRGGVAQGIGAVLLERATYDEDGQYLAGTFMDYLLPTATDIPRVEIHHLETNPLDPDVNFRGVGEGGMIVAPVTVVNAIEDALKPSRRTDPRTTPPARAHP